MVTHPEIVFVSLANRMFLKAIEVVDRLVPKRRAVVVRTLPDYCDQGRETVRALVERGISVVYLVDGLDRPRPPMEELPCEVRGARTLGGLVAYWRAKVVVHTHGVFGSIPGGRGKRFVNIWHGMPVKLLEHSTAVGHRQTDLTVATARVHADHLAATWDLAPERIVLTGLPRNDLLAGQVPEPPDWLAVKLEGRKLVLWMPTFRAGTGRDLARLSRSEGIDLGTETQFEGADLEAVDRLMGEVGALCIIKTHPLVPRRERVELPNTMVLGGPDLEVLGTTLYRLLAQADVLITDHSSVWIDFVLTGRPMVFTISDREQYGSDRGYYFDDLDALFPGPIVTRFADLAEPLRDALDGAPGWAGARAEALVTHHVHTDDGSAGRLADLIASQF